MGNLRGVWQESKEAHNLHYCQFFLFFIIYLSFLTKILHQRNQTKIKQIQTQAHVNYCLQTVIECNSCVKKAFFSWALLMELNMIFNIVNNIIIQRFMFPKCSPSLAFLTFLLFTITSVFCINQPTNFDYQQHGADWSCPTNGTKQSPIILTPDTASSSSDDSYLFCEFPPAEVTANYLNTTIYINSSDPNGFGSTYTKVYDGTSVPFKAAQMRVRMHSEHKIQGQDYFDIEVQIFHTEMYTTSRNFKMAIALFFQSSPQVTTPDPFIQTLIDSYDPKNPATIKLDLSQYLVKNVISDFWFYLGSVTLPPCTNGKVNWAVLRSVFPITADQKQKLKNILSGGDENWPGNWRAVQELNKNPVGFRSLGNDMSIL